MCACKVCEALTFNGSVAPHLYNGPIMIPNESLCQYCKGADCEYILRNLLGVS